jgi:hypothetical protein
MTTNIVVSQYIIATYHNENEIIPNKQERLVVHSSPESEDGHAAHLDSKKLKESDLAYPSDSDDQGEAIEVIKIKCNHIISYLTQR